jgi:hypothetical protein
MYFPSNPTYDRHGGEGIQPRPTPTPTLFHPKTGSPACGAG